MPDQFTEKFVFIRHRMNLYTIDTNLTFKSKDLIDQLKHFKMD